MRAQEEIKRIQSVPLVIGQFMEAIDQKYDIRLDASILLTVQHWYRAVLYRVKLCRPHPVHIRSRKAQTVLVGGAASSFQLAGRHPAARSRLVHRHAGRP